MQIEVIDCTEGLSTDVKSWGLEISENFQENN